MPPWPGSWVQGSQKARAGSGRKWAGGRRILEPMLPKKRGPPAKPSRRGWRARTCSAGWLRRAWAVRGSRPRRTGPRSSSKGRIRKSIKRFRDDPAWTYHKHAREYPSTFDRGGYPFSLGPDGLAIRNLLQGSFRGREVSLFRLLAWQRGAKANVAWTYSVAVLHLPRPLPATALTSRRLAASHRVEKRPALNRVTGPARDLPDLGTHLVHYCASDPDFAALISTYAMERPMHDARLGWRIEGNRMIGWTHGRETYEALLSLTETVAVIVDDFPKQAWHWPE